jgi:hypothetical protein
MTDKPKDEIQPMDATNWAPLTAIRPEYGPVGRINFGPLDKGPRYPEQMSKTVQVTTAGVWPGTIASGEIERQQREAEMKDRAKTRIVCAAIRLHDGTVLLGARHYDGLMVEAFRLWNVAQSSDIEFRKDYARSLRALLAEEGFVDQRGAFYDRKAALEIAQAAGQLRWPKPHPEDGLNSTDLY